MKLKIIYTLVFIFFLSLFEIGCSKKTMTDVSETAGSLEIRLVEGKVHDIKGTNNYEEMEDKDGIHIFVNRQVLFTEDDIKDIQLLEHSILQGQERKETYAILMKFKKEKSMELEKITANNLNKKLAIIIEGKLFSTPIIREVIDDREILITGSFTKEEAEKFVRDLNIPAQISTTKIREDTK